MTQIATIMEQLSDNRQSVASEPIDVNRLNQTLGAELLDQLPFLLGSLLDEMPTRLSQIDCAIQGNAWPEAVRMAHGIKGTSRWFAADALELSALELEEACRVRSKNAAVRGMHKVKHEAARLQDWLDRFLNHS